MSIRKFYNLRNFLVVSGLFVNVALADNNPIASAFANKDGCFILYDLNQQKIVNKYNSKHCAKRVAVDSTFKIALSLMSFEQGIITQKTSFKWDGKKRGIEQWNQDQTPQRWLRYSVVWVSQQLTPQLGMQKIKDYLKAFDYGNQDFSGTPGKNDGLTQAWLSNSLKISADEQLQFLTRLLSHQLPVTKAAVDNTKENLFLETLSNGWRLYGKTGSGHSPDNKVEGWFVGFIQKPTQVYVFVTNFTSLTQNVTQRYGGLIARDNTIKFLQTLKII